MLGITSVGFITGGALVARFGLDRQPLRVLLIANVAIAVIGMGTAVRESAPGRSSFGWLLGEGQARGLALAFVAASLVMLIVVLLAFLTTAYRRLSLRYDAVPVPA